LVGFGGRALMNAMDDFDDLLASSRKALEDNPFEDPFSKPRSLTPDPWTSSFAENPTSISGSEHPSSPFIVEPEHTPAYGASLEPESLAIPASPSLLESHNVPPLDGISPSVLSHSHSGFREVAPLPTGDISISPEAKDSPSVSIQNTASSPTAAFAPDEPAAPSSSLKNRFDSSRPITPPTPSASSTTLNLPTSTSESVFSPLDPPARPTEQPFPNLSLGGEAFGSEWQSTTNSSLINDRNLPSSTAGWQSRDPSVEDDDDDRPLQAIIDKSRAVEGIKTAESVRIHPRLFAIDSLNLHVQITTLSTNKENHPFTITVDDPQKVGDPIRGYTMYTVHTKVRYATWLCFECVPMPIPHLDKLTPVSFYLIFCAPTLFGLSMVIRNPLTQ
jgi:sorting nexin-1/2